jgi:predicted nucleotidyltransferase
MEEIQQTIKELLSSEESIRLCILYGSAASGRLHKESDIDIALAGDVQFSREHLADLQLALSSRPGYEVDIADMKNLEGLILSEILRKGKVLIEKDTILYAEFIKKVNYYNEDVLPNIRMILKKRAKRIARGN